MRTLGKRVSIDLADELAAALSAEGAGSEMRVDLARARVSWPGPVSRAFAAAEAVVAEALAENLEEADQRAKDDAVWEVGCAARNARSMLADVLKMDLPPAARERLLQVDGELWEF